MARPTHEIQAEICNSSYLATLDSESDDVLLQAVANTTGQRILLRLSQSPATQKELAADLDLNSGSLSKQMGRLQAAGIVRRPRPRSHEPYELLFKAEVLRLLQVSAQLSERVAESRLTEAKERTRAVNRAAIRPADGSAKETG